MIWLLTEDAARAMTDARRAGFQPTPEQRAQFSERVTAARDGSAPRNLSVAGEVAEIRVEGILTKTPDWMAAWFGGGNTTYQDIIAAIALAQNDPSVTRAVLYVDSPGGAADGLFDAIAALNAFTKPISCVASCACSAAYALASSAGQIHATGAAANFGSIGTACSYSFDADTTIVDLTNTDSPDKRPDVQTPEGKAVVIRYLDAVNELFVEAISHGRGVKPKLVTTDYGRGAILLAGEAKRLGMIDSIAQPASGQANGARARAEKKPMNLATLKADHPEVYAAAVREGKETAPTAPARAGEAPTASASPGGSQKEPTMDPITLKAQHPDVYASILAEGEKEGIAKERKRVSAHLTLGASSGDMKLAHDSIASGVSSMDEQVFAAYQSAAMNRRDTAARQTDDKAAAAALNGAAVPAANAAPDGAKDVVDQGVERFLASRGKAATA